MINERINIQFICLLTVIELMPTLYLLFSRMLWSLGSFSLGQRIMGTQWVSVCLRGPEEINGSVGWQWRPQTVSSSSCVSRSGSERSGWMLWDRSSQSLCFLRITPVRHDLQAIKSEHFCPEWHNRYVSALSSGDNPNHNPSAFESWQCHSYPWKGAKGAKLSMLSGWVGGME